MHIPRWGVCLLGVGCCGFVGCSQTSLLRPKGPSDMKTVASINGKPVSTVAGEPGSGSSQREDVDDLGPPPAAGSRISGRVFDGEGRAVPNARVRLGVGATAGGRVNFATTDRSGAFTLHGLRPGRDYTLIAEYQAEDGMMSGRVQAMPPTPASASRWGPATPSPSPLATRRSCRPACGPAFSRRMRPTDSRRRPPGRASRTPRTRPIGTASRPPRRPRPTAADEAGIHREAGVRPIVGDGPRRLDRPSAAHRTSRPAARAPMRTPTIPATARRRPAIAATGTKRARTRSRRRSSPTAPARRGLPDARAPARPRPVASPRTRQKARARRPDPTADDGLASDDREPGSLSAAPRPIPEDALPATTEIARASYATGGGRFDRRGRRPGARKPANVRRARAPHRHRAAARATPAESPDAADGRTVRRRHDSRAPESPAHLARAVDQSGRCAGRRGPAPQLGRRRGSTSGMP